MRRTLIKGGILHTMIDGQDSFQGDVLVENGKILEVAPEIHVEDVNVIEAEGCHVMPGLFDAHTHIGLFDFNHDKAVDDANEMTNPVSAAMDARYSMNPQARELKVAYEHGIT